LITDKNLIKEVIDLIKEKKFSVAKKKLLHFDQNKDHYYYNILGFVLQELGSFDDAEKNYIKAYKLNEKFLEAKFNQACLLTKKKSYAEAEKIFLDLINKNKDDYLSFYNIAVIKLETKDYNSAVEYFKKSLQINNCFFNAYHEIALTYEKLGNFDQAIKNYNTAILFNKEKINISSNNLGTIYLKLKRFEDAFKCFKEAIELKGDKSLVYYNIACAYSELGESFLAKTYMQKAVELNKKDKKKISNLLGILPYNHYDFKDYKFWSDEFSKDIKILNKNNKCNKINFEKKIRLGFVGADFVNHPVGFFLLDLLPKINSKIFDIYIYSNSPKEDDLTEKLKKNLIKWEKVFMLNNQEKFDLIMSEKIDILIDMSGHTDKNNLEIFANRAAPIQLTWAAYLATTGIKEIDYIIGDTYVTPIDTKEYFSERIINLPNIWCHMSTSNISKIDTVETPALKNGYITYGSFNNLNKINNEVIKVWSEILKKNSSSRLIIKNPNLDHYLAKKILFEKFRKNGVGNEQVILEGRSSREDLLKKYNSIDIALDTFPWNGGTTSFELSWMCVPLLTLSGDRFMSRCGGSINKNLNMNDWTTNNCDDYVLKATKYLNNFDLLNNVRKNLRDFSRYSSLFDTSNFSKTFVDCLDQILKIYRNKNG